MAPQRDQLISEYLKEKYVYDKIVEEQERWLKNKNQGRFTHQEMNFSKKYIKTFELRCKIEGIDIDELNKNIKK